MLATAARNRMRPLWPRRGRRWLTRPRMLHRPPGPAEAAATLCKASAATVVALREALAIAPCEAPVQGSRGPVEAGVVVGTVSTSVAWHMSRFKTIVICS